MSAIQSRVAFLSSIFVLFALPAQIFAQVIETVVLARVAGAVTVTNNATAESKAAVNGMIIGENFTVETMASGSVAMLFSNGSTTTLSPNTKLNISEFTQEEHSDRTNLADLEAEPSRSTTRSNSTMGASSAALRTSAPIRSMKLSRRWALQAFAAPTMKPRSDW